MKTAYSALSDKGKTRPRNEDSVAALPAEGIYLVSDGMGGEKAGEVASRIVSEVLPKLLSQDLIGLENPGDNNFLLKVEMAVSNLSAAVRSAGVGKPQLQGMGATLVAAIVRGSQALIVNVGDSRAYLMRNGVIEQISKDHSVVQILIDAGEITQAEADTHPLRGQIVRCIGMQGTARPDCFLVKLKPKDKLLLCSDGLTDMLTDEQMLAIVQKARVPKKSCEALIAAANEAGGHDNISALVIAFSASPEDKAEGKPTPRAKPAKKS